MVHPNFPPNQPGPRPGYQHGPVPQQQFAQQPFPQQPFPYQPPPVPPKASRAPLIVGLIALVAIAAAAVTLLIVAPWNKKDAGPADPVAQTFTLADGISVEVTVPEEWAATAESVDETTGVIIRADADNRPLTQIIESLSTFKESGIGEPVHVIVVVPTNCTENAPHSNTWTTREENKSSSAHTEKWSKAILRVDDHKCMVMSGIDAATDESVAGSTARDLMRSLINDDLITVGKSI
ncbi:MAG: hypothetical protein WBA98_05865 [Gordonia sp. (in: high G+C Gram-positive bacteria)]|uniref:hypothetical protein n=1 Tax=Gordonia sp. (in: high G+C Gram-positive bacteria) TaxID=84139 RepID=UPI003C74E921